MRLPRQAGLWVSRCVVACAIGLGLAVAACSHDPAATQQPAALDVATPAGRLDATRLAQAAAEAWRLRWSAVHRDANRAADQLAEEGALRAAQLADDLFADPTRVVTVRAEMSSARAVCLLVCPSSMPRSTSCSRANASLAKSI